MNSKRVLILIVTFLMMCSTAMAQVCKVTEYSWESGTITASGEYVHLGGCACDFLPMGTPIYIQGNTYIVNDRIGEDPPQLHIDVWTDSTEAANAWGVQYEEVTW